MPPILPFIFITLLLAACTDHLSDGPDTPGRHDTIRVSLRMAARAPQASHSWTYKPGTGGENIQSGFCVMVNVPDPDDTEQRFLIERVFTTTPEQTGHDLAAGDVITDDGSTVIPVTMGQKLFYTFANLTQEEVLAAVHRVEGMEQFAFTVGTAVDTALLNKTEMPVDAIGFQPTTAKGIPMTGRQFVSFSEQDNGKVRTLSVVRMMAKLQFDITNATGQPITVQSVRVNALANNATDAATGNVAPNEYLFPWPATPSASEGDAITLTPNVTLAGQTNVSPHVFAVGRPLADGEQCSASFYVNETLTPHNQFDCFLLTVTLLLADGQTTEQRYSLVSNDGDEWDFIARNDWRRIPIRLQNYQFELYPEDFPAIGVLPASVKEADGTFTCTFHYGPTHNTGHNFHLLPRIVDRSTGQPVTGWTASDVEWTTTLPNTNLYDQQPYWYAPGRYVHGRFKEGVTGRSIHTLTLTAAPDGVTARRFSAPVVINRVE